MISFVRLVLLDTVLRWKGVERSDRSPWRCVVRASAIAVQLVVCVNCLFIGAVLDTMMKMINPGMDVVRVAEDHLLPVLLAVEVVRFVATSPPFPDILPFRPFPVRKWAVIALFVIRTLTMSVNIIPLLCVIPFWLKNIATCNALAGSIFWIAGFVALHGMVIQLDIVFRLLAGNVRTGVILVGGIVLMIVLHEIGLLAMGLGMIGHLFALFRNGCVWASTAFVGVAVAAGVFVLVVLKESLYMDLTP